MHLLLPQVPLALDNLPLQLFPDSYQPASIRPHFIASQGNVSETSLGNCSFEHKESPLLRGGTRQASYFLSAPAQEDSWDVGNQPLLSSRTPSSAHRSSIAANSTTRMPDSIVGAEKSSKQHTSGAMGRNWQGVAAGSKEEAGSFGEEELGLGASHSSFSKQGLTGRSKSYTHHHHQHHLKARTALISDSGHSDQLLDPVFQQLSGRQHCSFSMSGTLPCRGDNGLFISGQPQSHLHPPHHHHHHHHGRAPLQHTQVSVAMVL